MTDELQLDAALRACAEARPESEIERLRTELAALERKHETLRNAWLTSEKDREALLASISAPTRAEARPSTEPGWQPIATAPKDGRVLIVLIGGLTLGRAYWGGEDIRGNPTWWAQGIGGVFTSWNATDQLTDWIPMPEKRQSAPPRAEALAPELDFQASVNAALRQRGCDFRIDTDATGQAICVPVPELSSPFQSAEALAPHPQHGETNEGEDSRVDGVPGVGHGDLPR